MTSANGLSPVRLETARLLLEVLPYGLTFHALQLKGDHPRDLLVGPARPEEHASKRSFVNVAVGPYANRVPAGSSLSFSGSSSAMTIPDDDGSGVCLHGGKQGLDIVVWKVIGSDESSLFKSAASGDGVRLFAHDAPATEQGFPGPLHYEALIELVDHEGSNPRLRYELRASTQADVSPANLTIHWGWRLDRASESQDDSVLSHKLWIKGSGKVQIDSKMLPTGAIDALDREDPLNFSQGEASDPHSHRPIQGPDGFVIDHNLTIDKHADDDVVTVLTSSDDAVSLKFRTNQSSVQNYTAVGFDGSGTRKASHARPGSKEGYNAFGSVFLEFHHPLSTFLYPELQKHAGTDTLLHKGEVYKNWVDVEVVAK